MSPRRTARCPRCQQPVRLDTSSFPFCSKRCRLIDLGKWFNEEYRVEKEEREWIEGEPHAKAQSRRERSRGE